MDQANLMTDALLVLLVAVILTPREKGFARPSVATGDSRNASDVTAHTSIAAETTMARGIADAIPTVSMLQAP